ncbi:MAG TPA: CYTH domain-containing protein [Gammaproteobacteria bacterium]|jgi:adenylate cyclase|nr:CYTH domain-containing protein [Gammaproteobacteria bacterium]
MPLEIERKYTVINDAWRSQAIGNHCVQGYLSLDPERTVRVRRVADQAWLTIKGRSRGMVRSEYEYPIPPEHAGELLGMCLQPLIEKTRYRVAHAGLTWEVDVFSGDNAGLVIAEIELESVSQIPELPAWVGDEVTDDVRYYNASLVRHPYRQWHEA